MSTVEEIKRAVVLLPPEDYQQLRSWLDAREAEEADQVLESAIAMGQFDDLAAKAADDFKSGRTQLL